MKSQTLRLSTIGLVIFSGILFTLSGLKTNVPQYQSRTIEKEAGNTAGGAIQYLNSLRANQETGKIDPKDVLSARAQAKLLASVKSASINWTELGPDNVGGRTRALLIDKDNSNIMYAGSVSGGLWKSTNAGSSWTKINDQFDNLAVSCITQSADGDIYFGTGEGLYYIPSVSGTGGAGVMGGGVWKSTDGSNFSQLSATTPTANTATSEWAFVNQIATDPSNNNRIYAATSKGLKMSDDGGATWTDPISNTGFATDVDVASDGTVITSIGQVGYISSNGNGGSFTTLSGGLPAFGNINRLEFTFAPSNTSVVYACASDKTDGNLYGVYQSVDKGTTWALIGPGGSASFEPLNGQGSYNMAVAVYPDDPYRVLVAGVYLWEWKQVSPTMIGVGQWENIASAAQSVFNPYYVHVDMHTIVFKPGDANTFFIGTDGGVFRTTNKGDTYVAMNKGYNVTQFYGIAFDPNENNGTGVMGGTQDNGTQYINGTGNSPQQAIQTYINDGGECEISFLNPNAAFMTSQYADLVRTPDKVEGAPAGFFSTTLQTQINTVPPEQLPFIAPIDLYENHTDLNSKDSVLFIADKAYNSGDEITVTSNTTEERTFKYKLTTALAKEDSLMVQDIVQAKLAMGFSLNIGVWLTKQALDFGSSDIEWIQVAGAKSVPDAFNIASVVSCLEFSKDGDVIYAGMTDGSLYRLSNISDIVDFTKDDINATKKDTSGFTVTTDSTMVIDTVLMDTSYVYTYDTTWTVADVPTTVVECNKIADFGNQVVTGVAVDPNDKEKLLVTLGNYGNSTYVWYSTTAASCASSGGTVNFTSAQGNLPAMPVYDGVILVSDGKKVILGTEFGTYYTTDITSPNWEDANGGMAFVPTFEVRQQTWPAWNVNNSGMVYIGTHGRGIWKTDKFYVPTSVKEESAEIEKLSVSIYPNPMLDNGTIEFKLKEQSNVTLKLYDLQGKLMRNKTFNNLRAGTNILNFDVKELAGGTYFLVMEKDGVINASARFVVSK